MQNPFVKETQVVRHNDKSFTKLPVRMALGILLRLEIHHERH